MQHPIKLVSEPVAREDINALCEWLQQEPTPQLSKGKLTKQFEEQWAKLVGRKYACFVNSGSTANYLMFRILEATNSIKNKKVVIPALCWITSVSPALQMGMEVILCDINYDDLSVDYDQLEKIFREQKPSIFLCVPILGLVPDMQRITNLCAKYGVMLLIDNCESVGSRFFNSPLEHFGLMSTSSNYIGHQLVAVEGGMLCTDDIELYEMAMMLRSHGWDRDLSEEKQKELRKKWNVSKFQQLYSFFVPAYNFRNSEINSFIGLRNLAHADEIFLKRAENYALYRTNLSDKLWKPKHFVGSFVSALGYPLISKHRDEIAEALRGNNVECRPLVSGSMTTQPFFIERYGKVSCPNAERLNDEGMYLPLHPKMTEEEIKFVCEIVNRFA